MPDVTLPDYELTRRLIQIFSADTTMQELLFPSWAPSSQGPKDTRIYGAHVDLREPSLLTVLPRIIIDSRLVSNDWEQPDIKRSGPVVVHFHSLSPREQYYGAELIDTRIRTILSSTYLTNTRIISSELVPEGQRRRYVETKFDDAWRVTSRFEAQNVGVLV